MKHLLAAICLFPAAPALAAGSFVAPKGCHVYVTVQHSDCQVSNHYRCDADTEGEQWSVYGGPEGPFYMSKIDSETRWIEDADLTTGERGRLGHETDPASFTELLATNLDSYDFTTESSNGTSKRYQGYDHLTGKTVTIGPVTLEQTEFELTTYDQDGKELAHRKGNQFIDRDWRLFFSDSEQVESADGDKGSFKNAPVAFAFPGDAGFESQTPKIGCDVTSASAPALPEEAPLWQAALR